MPPLPLPLSSFSLARSLVVIILFISNNARPSFALFASFAVVPRSSSGIGNNNRRSFGRTTTGIGKNRIIIGSIGGKALHHRRDTFGSGNRNSARHAVTQQQQEQQQEQQRQLLLPNVDALRDTISSGRVYVHDGFLTENEIQWLLEDMARYEDTPGAFARSGLSDTSKGTGLARQGFGTSDRSVCPVPWFRTISSAEHPNEEDDEGGAQMARKLQRLKRELAVALDRPNMMLANTDQVTLQHECYYSLSREGSFLQRHMDERHEELKGAKGWLLPSRRSLSWLIYLTAEDWNTERDGGALRAFPQIQQPAAAAASSSPQHDGNLQIGWLRLDHHYNKATMPMPVYLDSWYPVEVAPPAVKEPHCILYAVHKNAQRVFLTRPWLTDVLPHGLSVPDFLKRQAAQYDPRAPANLFVGGAMARGFYLLEDRDAWRGTSSTMTDGDGGADTLFPNNPPFATVQDVSPARGRLVVFDSVRVPHQVQPVLGGRRAALAGWFHEPTQAFRTDLCWQK